MALLIIWMMCLTTFPSPVPLMKQIFILMPMFFFFSELKYLPQILPSLRQTVLWNLSIWMLFAAIILFLHSPHYNHSIVEAVKFFEAETICSYFIILFPLVLFRGAIDMRYIYRVFFFCLLALTVFGVLNLLFHRDVFIDFIYSGRAMSGAFEDLGSKYQYADRFRVHSMFLNPFDYGYICLLALLFNFYCRKLKFATRKEFLISLFGSIFGILSCNTRTLLLCSIVGVLVYFLCVYNIKQKVRIALIACIVGVILLNVFPSHTDYLGEMILSVFDSNSNVQGSSWEMREMQFLAVLYHIKDNLLLGNGKGYFYIDMGYAEGGLSTLVDHDLLGLEGVYLFNLLERGIIGTIFYYVYWIAIILLFHKLRKFDKSTTGFALALISSYLCFAHFTGELSSLAPTLFFIGMAYAMIKLHIHNNQTINI
ncbi:MAG: hypothetical protein IJX44_03920 [Bacteroidaceae bacterium]|nr:hypothetical protein [Bacteroidaceae bacterium]